MSDESAERVIRMAHSEGGDIIWDNINIANRVPEQRIGSTDSFENGTTATFLKRYFRDGKAYGSLVNLGLLPPRLYSHTVFKWEVEGTMPYRKEVDFSLLCIPDSGVIKGDGEARYGGAQLREDATHRVTSLLSFRSAVAVDQC